MEDDRVISLCLIHWPCSLSVLQLVLRFEVYWVSEGGERQADSKRERDTDTERYR